MWDVPKSFVVAQINKTEQLQERVKKQAALS